MRKALALLSVGCLLAVPAGAVTTVLSKPPDQGPQWSPLSPDGGSYAYADSFVAPAGDTLPIRLGTWLRELEAPAPSVRFEIWGDDAGPSAEFKMATTGSVSPAATGTLAYFEYPVTGLPSKLVPGQRYWFVATVVGEAGDGAYEAGGHTQNSVVTDDGVFYASSSPYGQAFDFGPTTPEMAFQVELAPQILLLDDGCVVASQFAAALQALGLDGATTITDMEGFEAALVGGTPWDLVLVDSYNNEMETSALEALVGYVESGGLLAVAYWDLANEPLLAAAVHATPTEPFNSAREIWSWDATHDLFTAPAPLGAPLTPLSDACTQDGGAFEPTTQGTAIGGYVASPTTGQTAIVIGNSGRSVLLGEVLHVFASLPGLGGAAPPADPGVLLAGNTIHYLLETYLFGNDFEIETSCRWTLTTPPATEACNGLDDDCNHVVDDVPGSGDFCPTGELGICAEGITACVGEALDCVPANEPQAELCNGLDDDCDGAVDDGNPGAGEACETGSPGICAAGLTLCDSGELVCDSVVSPQAETCDGVDENCDGVIDDGDPGGGAACDTGIPGLCAAGLTLCDSGGLICAQFVFPGTETCDGLDEDCDGVEDNGDPGGGESCDTGQPGICWEGVTRCFYGELVCDQLQSAEESETSFCADGLDNDCDGFTDCNDDDCIADPCCGSLSGTAPCLRTPAAGGR